MARSGGCARGAPHGDVRKNPGTRYVSLGDSVPELGGTQRHTVEQIIDTAPGLPMLDVPVPLMVEQPAEVLHFFDTFSPVAEQVINVPKIILEDIRLRALVREPQLVPTVPQTVGTPTLAFLRDFRPGGGQGPIACGAPPAQSGIQILDAVPAIQEQIAAVVAVDLWTSL